MRSVGLRSRGGRQLAQQQDPDQRRRNAQADRQPLRSNRRQADAQRIDRAKGQHDHAAEVARRDGILALENATAEIKDPFLVSGIQMAVDGTDPDQIESILLSDLEAVEARHADGKALFDSLGRYTPAFGMIGTLIGLVIMLKNMDDPSKIGPAMAVALLTTLYGALAANLVALPLADKLAIRSRDETAVKMIVIKGVMAIQTGDNPRIVEQKLKTFLPARMRNSEDSFISSAGVEPA